MMELFHEVKWVNSTQNTKGSIIYCYDMVLFRSNAYIPLRLKSHCNMSHNLIINLNTEALQYISSTTSAKTRKDLP